MTYSNFISDDGHRNSNVATRDDFRNRLAPEGRDAENEFIMEELNANQERADVAAVWANGVEADGARDDVVSISDSEDTASLLDGT